MVMHVELQATCSALGYQEGEQYVKEPDCLETIKDLIRFLKREDDTCDIRRQLGDAQILQKDLIPIVKQYKDDVSLFETVLRLLVNLTQPTVLCFGNKLPTDKIMRNHALEIDTHLQTYKESFVDEELFAVLAEKVGNILKLDWESRQEEDKLLLERLLILLRNILHIPPNPDLEQRTDDDASLHDQILWVIHVSGLEDMILYIASSENERHLCMHVLEIVSLMFREQTPETLACAGAQRSVSEKEKDERELQMIREKERAMKKMNMLKHSTRHSRFGGTYVVTNMKSISDRDLIYHKAQAEVKDFTLDNNKRPKKKPKNREPIKDKEISRRSTLSIRLSLKEFCVQFLENAYNPLMYAVKDNLTRERTQEHDETYYMWALRFFMEFCRHHSKRVELVSETLSVPTFHYIYTNLVTYYEMIMTEKTEAITWSKRVHLALKAYQELLLTVDMMDRSKNPQLMESSKVIKSNVFYVMEFRDIFVTLLKKFDQSKQSRTYLRDLVETSHLFVKMLEHFCKKTSHLVVQKKKKKNKKKPKPKVLTETAEPTQQELEDLWDEISGQLSGIFQGREDVPEVAPFDAASDVEVDQQRVEAMCRIQNSMRNRLPGEAVAIFRAAREVWPERDEFGTQNMAPEEEFMALREIFMAPLPKPNRPSTQTQEMEEGFGDVQELPEEEEQEEEEEREITSEQEFDLTGFLMTFCKPDVLKAYGLLLADFEKNSDHTNHCIVKMLHRVAVDMGFPGMIFQASIFRVFQKILLGPYTKLPRFKEMMKFATYVVGRFVEVAERNKKIFMEMLFWKGSKEAQEICEGYGSVSAKKGKATWSEELEQELERLWEEFRDAEDPEQDAVDLILGRLTDPSKTRNHVIAQLKRQGLIQSAKELKKSKKPSQRRAPWTPEEEEELTELYHRFKDGKDTVPNIVMCLSTQRSKQKITDKLLSLGLVQHRSELYNRRSRKQKDIDEENREHHGSDSEGSVDDNLPNFTTSESESAESEGETPDKKEEEVSVGDKLKSLVEKGYKDQVAWIQRGLRRTAEDRERDDYRVAVPIVPLTEENETAMEDQQFLDFIQLIGIAPPANEQEAFWRIPADLSATELRNIVEGLELDPDGNPVAADKIKPVQMKKKKSRKTKKVSKSQRKVDKEDLKKKDEENRQKQKERQEEKQKSRKRMKALKTLAKQRKTSTKRKRNESSSNDESESEKESVTMETNESPMVNEVDTESSIAREKTQPKKKSRMKKVVDSDSDSDMDRLRIDEGSDNDSDAAKPPTKRPKLFDSDSGDETNQGSQDSRRTSQEQKNRLFESDSDSSDNEEGRKSTSGVGGKSANLSVSASQISSTLETEHRADGSDDSDMDSASVSSSVVKKGRRRNRAIKSDSESDVESVTVDQENSNLDLDEVEKNKSQTPVSKVKEKKLATESGKKKKISEASKTKKTPVKKLDPVSDTDSVMSSSLRNSPEQKKSTKKKSSPKEKSKSVKKQQELDKKLKKEKSAKKHLEEKENKSAKKKASANKKNIDSDSEDEPLKTSSKPNKKNKEDLKSKPKRKTAKSKRQREDSSSEDEVLSSVKEKQPKAKRQRVVQSDTEMSPLQLSVSQSPDTASQSDTLATQDVPQDTSKLFNSDDDSSSDDEPLLNTVKAKLEKVGKSAESFPATLLTQPLGDSDSDVDDHVPLRKVMRKKIIDSEED